MRKRNRKGKAALALVTKARENYKAWKFRYLPFPQSAKSKCRSLGLTPRFLKAQDFMFREVSAEHDSGRAKLFDYDLGKLEERVLASGYPPINDLLKGGIPVGGLAAFYAGRSDASVRGKSGIMNIPRSLMTDGKRLYLDPTRNADYISRLSDMAWTDKEGICDLINKIKAETADYDIPIIGYKSLHDPMDVLLSKESREHNTQILTKAMTALLNRDSEESIPSDSDLSVQAQKFQDGVTRFCKVLKERKANAGSIDSKEDLESQTIIEIDSVPDFMKNKE
jgi:hypothetical protein